MPAEKLTGGCLCGKVRYELSAGVEPLYSVICHCLNCKKATGGHMLNASLFLKKVSRYLHISSSSFPNLT